MIKEIHGDAVQLIIC